MSRVYTVRGGSSADAVESILGVCFPDLHGHILDTTYGHGSFWAGSSRKVIGVDIDPSRARDVCADFNCLPFPADAVDVTVFDPPYQSDMGRGKPSIMGSRFGHAQSITDILDAVSGGCREAWRVARLGIIVKVQDYIHGGKAVWMSERVREAIGQPPYDVLYLQQRNKMIDPKWTDQLSIWRNHSTFWVYRKGSQSHVRRNPA